MPEVGPSSKTFVDSSFDSTPDISPLYDASLHRVGLLRPMSYSPSSPLTRRFLPGSLPTSHRIPHHHSQHTIRLTTMQLSDMPASTSAHSQNVNSAVLGGVPLSAPSDLQGLPGQWIPPYPALQHGRRESSSLTLSLSLKDSPIHASTLSPHDTEYPYSNITHTAVAPLPPAPTSNATSPMVANVISEPKNKSLTNPSGLSLLRRESPPSCLPSRLSPSTSGSITPTGIPSEPDSFESTSVRMNWFKDRGSQSERTSLLLPVSLRDSHSQNGYGTPEIHISAPENESTDFLCFQYDEVAAWKKVIGKTLYDIPVKIRMGFSAIPAVLLGALLNILDGISYGMIVFPSTGVFAGLGPMGVSLFLVSTIVAQLTYTFGGSTFVGGNGSMMIEVVPFFHMIANSIASEIGAENPREIIATTLVAFILSSILTGLSFFLLGVLKLGTIVGFFPRHILVGCIGGIGAFLIQTGLTVCMHMSEENFTMSLETLNTMFLDHHMLLLWTIPLALAILLRIITHRFNHQLVFPVYFLVIPIIFYIVVAAARLDLNTLRMEHWLLDAGKTSQTPWYHYYSYLDYRLVRFGALRSTLPTQLALLFFNILHPPLNVPALAVSLDCDCDTNKELIGHGYSNLLSGLIGSVPNYLVYVNTLLFYRVGGDSRVAGFLLAAFTCVILFIGASPIAYIPVTVVGALIFVLGIDLVKEALWDTRHRVSRMEYITIIGIMIAMTAWDFVIGVLFGIVVSCFFFVVQNSQIDCIRSIYTGDTAMSAVRRSNLQRAYIREVAKQTTILRLQGFLFFGTISRVEETIRCLFEAPSWQKNPIQYLVVDLILVAGVDMSAAEAFVRIQRLLFTKSVVLVFCGFSENSVVGRALQNVDVLGAEGVELFSTFSDAMEWTENEYLRSWFRSNRLEPPQTLLPVPVRRDPAFNIPHIADSFAVSPRRSHIWNVGVKTIGAEFGSRVPEPEVTPDPLNTLSRAFPWSTDDVQKFKGIARYFSRIIVPTGHILWERDDNPDGLYVVESGVLRATYEFRNQTQRLEEAMVSGTIAGELSALSNLPRNATCVVEHHATLWMMSMQDLDRLRQEEPALSASFVQLILKAGKTDYDLLLSAVACRQ